MRRGLLLSLAALALLPSPVCPQGNPLGPEFRVNTYTTGLQGWPDVAAGTSGFVVTWMSAQDGASYGVFGQRYDSSGAPLGPEFRVNTFTTSVQEFPSIAADVALNFVVVWPSNAQDGSSYGVFGQRFASSGTALGAEFRVNTVTTASQAGAEIAADAAGNFVVVWQSDGQDGSIYGVFGQRFASSGAPLGPEFRVNSYTTGSQYWPAVAADPAGNFVVVWTSPGQDGASLGVFGQRYASSGSPLGPEFRVNTYTTDRQYIPSVAADPSGSFVVVWNSLNQDGSSFGVFGQRFASSGAPLGPEFRVNTYTTSSQGYFGVTSDADGNFVVVWNSLDQDGSSFGMFGQRFGGSGSPLGPEFRINTYTTSEQGLPSVASDPSGNFIVSWVSNGQDGFDLGVYGQRYNAILPVELVHFRVE
jgi:hypothetical protein